MAMVLDAFASYVSDLLKQVMEDEVGMLLGVHSQISSLEEKLQLLKDFLTDAEKKRITDKHVQSWVGKLKDVMYQATDILDICQIKAMESGVSDNSGCCNCKPLLFCLRNPLLAQDIGSRIKALNQRLDDIKRQGDDFKFTNLSSYEDRRPVSPLDSRKTSSVLEQSSVVGEKIKYDTRTLVEMLTKNGETSRAPVDNKMMVVAIVGMGGIGKTTLAKNIFRDESITYNFDKKIWLSVTQNFSEAELLRTAITAAGGDHHGNMERPLLEPALAGAIKDKKIFLVLDDMWSEKEWNNLLRAPFSYGAKGSRVLVTTRDERVARGMQANNHHRVDKLKSGDAWLLLTKQIAQNEIHKSKVEALKEIGMKIVGRCDGLPLAVKVLGGLLCRRLLTRDEWEKVLHHSTWSLVGMPDELNHALYLSYEDLSPQLKQCLLHYSLLPKNKVIFRHEIVGMWISEGFVHESTDELEELGRDYYDELIMRNLIEPDIKYVDQAHCIMHDVVRSFAQYMSRDEALVAHNRKINKREIDSQKYHRLSIDTTGLEPDALVWSLLQKQKSLRTLISFGPIKFKPGDSLSNFPSLRTLRIDSRKFALRVHSLCQLKHLRYLSINNTDISSFPDEIGKMKFLQHINFRGCEIFDQLPNSIVQLGHLRYLNLLDTKIKSIPRGFSGLTNLREMRGYPSHMGGVSRRKEEWCSLEELGPLSQLRVLSLICLENVSSSAFAAKAGLRDKKHLHYLDLGCTSRMGENISEEEKKRIEEVFEELCPAPNLRTLLVGGYFGRQLPNWMMSATLKSLRFLSMDDLFCCTQLPSSLCQLPYLQLFQIRRAPAIKRVGPEFMQLYHHGRSPPQVEAAFPSLADLRLRGMVEWEEWKWEEQQDIQALPVLELLVIDTCKLRDVPPGLAFHARALKSLHVYNVHHLNSLENFASVVELELFENPDLERVANLPKLQKLTMVICPKLKALQGVPALRNLVLEDYNMETLPGYLRDVKPRHLQLVCSLPLLRSIAMEKDGPEWEKLSDIQQVKAYADDGDNNKRWYVLYTRNPYSWETNIGNASSRPSSFRPELRLPREAAPSRLLPEAVGIFGFYKRLLSGRQAASPSSTSGDF